jgi:hypothetical protein
MFSREQELAIVRMGTATARIIKMTHFERNVEYDDARFWDTFSLYVEQRPFLNRMDETFEPPSAICRNNPIIVHQLTLMKHMCIMTYFKRWFPNSDYGNYEEPTCWGPQTLVRSNQPTRGLFPRPCIGVPYRLQWLHELQWGTNGDILTLVHFN